ncbi:MAG: hypothetical protein KGH72_00310 [Candidatus Micrarchaeota archaeon]|nr:hypothetical protein [Candidatus Micrarchaeota archaeon]
MRLLRVRDAAKTQPTMQSILDEKDILRQGELISQVRDPKLQLRLAQSEDWDIRNELARNRNLANNVQHVLASDSHPYVRSNLAKHTRIPKIQLVLATDRSSRIRQSLAGNENITKEVQLILAVDPSVHVRSVLALQGNKLDPEVIEILLQDKKSEVRHSLALTKNTTDIELLKRLAVDRSRKVKIEVVERLFYGRPDKSLVEELHPILEMDRDPEVIRALERMDFERQLMADTPKMMDLIRRGATGKEVVRALRRKE